MIAISNRGMIRFFALTIVVQLVVLSGALGQVSKGLEPAEAPERELTGKRLALLVGNARYQHATPLLNPENDVEVMSRTLKQAHFDVIPVMNADLRQLRQSLDSFTLRLQEEQYDVGLYYYSGHGMEVGGVNYLLPVEANPKSPADVPYDCLDAQRILAKMEDAGVRTKILILDACRDNPLARSWTRTAGRKGLVQMDAPEGTFIGYSTEPGSASLDGSGVNSPYTTALATHLIEPGISIADAFTKVAKTTQMLSTKEGRRQVPFNNFSLTDLFFFIPEGESIPERSAAVSMEVPLIGSGRFTTGRMIMVEGGSFWMGCDSSTHNCQGDELPMHRVSLADFYISETEVTVAQFSEFIKETNYQTDAEKNGGSYVWNGTKREKRLGVDWRCDVAGNKRPAWEEYHPVIHVSWNDAMAYVSWLSWKTKLPYRLPTEAEWEYAARGGNSGADSLVYAGSSVLQEVAWFHLNADGRTHPVKEKKSNALGLFDMNGNVWEWCSDWYHPGYSKEDQKGPNGPPNGTDKVNRGGSWRNLGPYCNNTIRSYDPPDFSGYPIGFRLARSR